MTRKLIGLLCVKIGIGCLLTSCAAPPASTTPSAPPSSRIAPYFTPREIRTSIGPTDNRDRIYEFLKENVVDRTVSMATRDSRIDQGRIATDFAVTMTLTNLRKTRYGLEYDLESTVEQTNYDLDSSGRRTGVKRVEDREQTGRCHLRQMKSTGEVVGYSRMVSYTTKSDLDPTGSASAVRMRLSGGKLIIESAGVNYGDYFAYGGRFRTGWSHREDVLEIKAGKLSWQGLVQSYNFNPRTQRFEYTGRSSYPLLEVVEQ